MLCVNHTRRIMEPVYHSPSRPAAKALIFVLAGMASGYFFNITPAGALIISIVIAALALILFLLGPKLCCFPLCSLAIGIILSPGLTFSAVSAPDKILPEMPAIISGKITSVLSETPRYMKCIVSGSADAKQLPRFDNVSILLTVINDDAKNTKEFLPGMSIVSDCSLRLPARASLPGEFDERQYLRSSDIQFIGRALSTKTAIRNASKDIFFYSSASAKGIMKINEKLYSPDILPIINALLVADKSGLTKEVKNAFSFSGTSHVLAVSGLHLAMISFILFFVLGFVKNQFLKLALFSLAITIYVFISGLQPSAIRAAVMSCTFMAARSFQRKTDSINILSFAVLVILLFEPTMIFSGGFQMSVASVYGILIFYKPLNEKLHSLIRLKDNVSGYIISSIAVSISASIIVSPIVAAYFGIFSIVSPLANLIVIPLMNIALIYSLLALPFYAVSTWAGGCMAALAELSVRLAVKTNMIANQIPHAFLTGSATMLIAAAVSASLIYLVLAPGLRTTLFRAGMIALAGTLLFGFIIRDSDVPAGPRLYPRNKFVALDIPAGQKKRAFMIIDRKPAQRPTSDYAFESYLKSLNDTLIFVVNGNAGIAISDKLKKVKPVRILFAGYPLQFEIEKIIGAKCHFSQIIEMDN